MTITPAHLSQERFRMMTVVPAFRVRMCFRMVHPGFVPMWDTDATTKELLLGMVKNEHFNQNMKEPVTTKYSDEYFTLYQYALVHSTMDMIEFIGEHFSTDFGENNSRYNILHFTENNPHEDVRRTFWEMYPDLIDKVNVYGDLPSDYW